MVRSPRLPAQFRTLAILPSDRSLHGLLASVATACGCEINFAVAHSENEGLARLEAEPFDLLILWHAPPALNALRLLDALAARSRADLAVVVLGHDSEHELLGASLAQGADAYLCLDSASPDAFLWQVARALERRRLVDELSREQRAQDQRREHEREEAARLVRQQRRLAQQLTSTVPATVTTAWDSPPPPDDRSASGRTRAAAHFGADQPLDFDPHLATRYSELLQAYLITRSGALSSELAAWIADARAAGFDGRQALACHVSALEALVDSLGQRSARHAVARADLLALELLARWTSG